MYSRKEIRNSGIGLAASFVILALAAVFFHDAGEGAWTAIVFCAFAFTFVVTHSLDALDARRDRAAERATRSAAAGSSKPQGPVQPGRASSAPAAPRAS